MDKRILDLTSDLLNIKEDLSKANEKKTELEKKKKQIEYALYYAMESDNIKNFKHDEFGTTYRSHRVWCKITDPEKAYKYLKEQGVYDDVMQLEVKSGRLNKLIKEQFLDKTGVIPEIEIGIQATLSPMIGNRQAKLKGGEDSEERPEGL